MSLWFLVHDKKALTQSQKPQPTHRPQWLDPKWQIWESVIFQFFPAVYAWMAIFPEMFVIFSVKVISFLTVSFFSLKDIIAQN